jgi:hypothetical protein
MARVNVCKSVASDAMSLLDTKSKAASHDIVLVFPDNDTSELISRALVASSAASDEMARVDDLSKANVDVAVRVLVNNKAVLELIVRVNV